jgi:hypothetical protein
MFLATYTYLNQVYKLDNKRYFNGLKIFSFVFLTQQVSKDHSFWTQKFPKFGNSDKFSQKTKIGERHPFCGGPIGMVTTLGKLLNR